MSKSLAIDLNIEYSQGCVKNIPIIDEKHRLDNLKYIVLSAEENLQKSITVIRACEIMYNNISSHLHLKIIYEKYK